MTSKKLKVLFVASGRKSKALSSTIINQGESLRREGVDIKYYMLSGRGWKGYLCNVRTLRTEIKNGDYDLIHAHYGLTAYLTSLATIGLRVLMVVSLMGNDILDHWWYPGLVRQVAKLKPWRAVIVKSQEMRNRVRMQYANVVPNGVNLATFKPMNQEECQVILGWDTTKKHILFPARMEDTRKNWPLAFDAIELLNKRIGDRSMVISNCNGIELHQMNGVPNDKTPILYNAADVVVLPSFYEGSANAVKEAMACNVPLVTTDMGDCRERIEGVYGCYVAKTYNVEELADLLGKALAFGGKTKGRERLLEDGIADYQIAQRIIQIYENVMNNGR